MFRRSNKVINWLISKGVSSFYLNRSYWGKLTCSKLWFSESKKFVFRPVFDEFLLMQISLNFKILLLWIFNYFSSLLNLKNQKFGSKSICRFFNFERNYNILKSKSPCFLLNRKVNFSKCETESKMKNPTDAFRGTN